MRAEKEAEEIGCIEKAVAIAETALADVIPEIREGVSERELAAELEYRLRSAGSGPPPFETIVAAGPNAALPHHRPGDRRLRAGDLVLLDFGADFGGYCSDLTRTFVLGAPERWQREAHRAVREACRRGVEAATAGAVARDVDRAARDVLEQAGLGDRFGHGTGHGIGLEVHEAPRIHRRGEERLRVGNVVTIEPGVYLPGRGGIRIEEDVVVEEGGPRLLTSCSTELIEL
jgi:Xaa-Pro aminopeptidase